MYDHERSLVKKYSGRPFVLLGVNTDEQPDFAREAVHRNNLNWRSWYDGAPGGPISQAFGVRGYPTILLVDHHGVIQHRSPFGDVDMDDAIESLVSAAEADGVTGGAAPKAKVREFVDSTGEHKTVASYVGFADGNAALETESGETVKVPWTRLSLEDQRYVANQRLKAAGLARIAKENILFPFDQPQTFWDESGQHSIVGTYIALDGRSAVIWQEDGTEVRVSYSKLSDETKDLIKEEIKKRK